MKYFKAINALYQSQTSRNPINQSSESLETINQRVQPIRSIKSNQIEENEAINPTDNLAINHMKQSKNKSHQSIP